MTERKTLSTPGIGLSSVLVLRTCNAKMRSHEGRFVWPSEGEVSAPDWKPTVECGNGLHGWLWGEGDGNLGRWEADARWLVVEVEAASIIDLQGKVKFPAGRVVFVGDRIEATTYLSEHGAAGRAIVGGTSTSGYGGTSTSGYGGTSTSGDGGTSTSGYGGTLIVKRWDSKLQRYRTCMAEVGVDGIAANRPYKLNDEGLFVPADDTLKVAR
jgi:hypothetical protein